MNFPRYLINFDVVLLQYCCCNTWVAAVKMRRVNHILLALCTVLGVMLSVPAVAATKTSKAKAAAVSTKKKVVSTKKRTAVTAKVSKRKPVRVVSRVRRAPADQLVLDHNGNPMLQSSAFIVQDLSSGEVILEKNASSAVPIASITKLMTAMVVLDAHQSMDDVLRVSNEDIDHLKGTSSRLAIGAELSREEMLRLALMASENRAASALARHYPGGAPAFIAAMNEKAASLELAETRFYDSTGLNKSNVSSARDLARLVAAASHYPLIREFSTASDHTVTVNGRERQFRNTNSLVSSSDWQIGVSKTGYINESGKCLVMQAWLGNKPVAIVLLDSWGRYTRLGDANRVRKWLETALTRKQI